MADGSIKNIEDVQVGDVVRGGLGSVNKVLALDRPICESGEMWLINGYHVTTANHPHVGVDRKFYRIHMPEYGTMEVEVEVADGKKEIWSQKMISKGRQDQIGRASCRERVFRAV